MRHHNLQFSVRRLPLPLLQLQQQLLLPLVACSLVFAYAPVISLASAQTTTAHSIKDSRQASGQLMQAFEQAAKEFNVPRDLLVAIAYAETHFDDHNAEPSADNGFGVMHLVDNPDAQTLAFAAALLQVSPAELKINQTQNIRGAAAILSQYADDLRLNEKTRSSDLSVWYEAVARFSNASDDAVARLYADEIYRLLNQGFGGTSNKGEQIKIGAQAIKPQRGRFTDARPLLSPDYQPPSGSSVSSGDETLSNNDATVQSTDYAPALYVAANSGNYTAANRESDYPINYVVIHTTQGSYASAINWFQNAAANVSAHYVVRSSDGQITQMVREHDIAYHAGNWTYNTQSIGIEHEGFVNDASWYTDAMYRASAALTRNVCLKYGIPMTRTHIIGHSEVPGATHTDPGPNWNWTYYMQLVTQSTAAWSQIVDNTTVGRFTASANWGTSAYDAQRYAADYRFATPQAVSDAAWYKFDVPATANYEVYAWYPANSGYNAETPYVIVTSSGNRSVSVNQQINGGTWVSLGVFNITAGDKNVVAVSRWASGTGYVIADAVRLVRR